MPLPSEPRRGELKRALEIGVGTGLLLGPLVYALTLTQPAEFEPLRCTSSEPVLVAEPALVSEPGAAEPSKPSMSPPSAPSTPDVELAEFLFVTDAGLVLSDEAERGWGRGKLFEPPGEVSYRAAKRADPAKLPTALWTRAGRTYDLYGPDGKVCTARLGELRVLGQYDGWTVGGLVGDEWYDTEEQPSKAAIRTALWARDDLWLVAEIATTGSCEGALWARDAELPPPAVLRESTAHNPISKRRLAQFQRSDTLAEAKVTYETQYAELLADDPELVEREPAWPDYVKQHPATVRSWLDAQARPQLLHLEFGREEEGCGDMFAINHAALELVRGDGFDEIVSTSANPMAVFDADGDGQLELLFQGHEGDPYLLSATLGHGLTVEYDAYCPC